MASAFSKVGDLVDDDEEEERTEMSRRAQATYRKAQDAYNSRGSNEEVLRLFQEAEEAMKPLLGSGLAGLDPQELETVLKGRLHQAVVTAHLDQLPNRWGKVKSLAEDVLQFDFNNAHARWLRGLSLMHGLKMPKEAEEECRRAAECARLQGKVAEASQWEAEIQRSFAEARGAAATAKPAEDAGDDAIAEADEIVEPEVPKKPAVDERVSAVPAASVAAPKASKKTAAASPTLQKGFFNKPSKKEEDAAKGVQDTAVKASQEAESGAAAREAKLQQELQELRKRMQEQEVDLLKQLQQVKAEQEEEQRRLRESAEVIAEEFEQYLSELHFGSSASASSSSAKAQERLKAGAQQVRERAQAGRAWAEKEQQRYVDVSTEVLTLQEMTSREARERQEASNKQSSELRELAKRFGDLTKSAKTLDDYVRFQSAGDEEKDEPDMQRLAERVADFHGLPLRAKIAAMLDDGAVLSLMILTAVLGMLFMLGLLVEAFSAKTCRLACSR